ncbi:MAG: phosphate/phosphite/phosphonate ABC transporter substrate-binding protein [Alphaproteobacteria bacterium]|nr:phosphate/phosphite/phosphonate ABC transporter substrate-binding protein [Alphaproteobacteria bacterium]
MIASLGMYARPQTLAATARFWAEIRDRLRAKDIAAPQELEQDTPFWPTWRAQNLLFSQTCGRPFAIELHHTVTLIGTPDYGHENCPPGYYRSAFVTRRSDPRTTLAEFAKAVFAYNETSSQSGWASPKFHMKKHRLHIENIHETGGHTRSARAVAEGHADIAAIDALSWDMIKQYDDFASKLTVIDWTDPTPGLPYITAKTHPRDIVKTAVQDAISALTTADQRVLRLKSLVHIPPEHYLSLPSP